MLSVIIYNNIFKMLNITADHPNISNQGDQIGFLNGYEDIDRNMFFKLKVGSRTRVNKVTLVTEQCRLDWIKYSFFKVLNVHVIYYPLYYNKFYFI